MTFYLSILCFALLLFSHGTCKGSLLLLLLLVLQPLQFGQKSNDQAKRERPI